MGPAKGYWRVRAVIAKSGIHPRQTARWRAIKRVRSRPARFGTSWQGSHGGRVVTLYASDHADVLKAADVAGLMLLQRELDTGQLAWTWLSPTTNRNRSS